MKDTIKAKNGYVVRRKVNSDRVKVLDGESVLFVGTLRTMEDYIDEVEDNGNECAVFWEVFTTIKGNRFIYWGDTETGEDCSVKNGCANGLTGK